MHAYALLGGFVLLVIGIIQLLISPEGNLNYWRRLGIYNVAFGIAVLIWVFLSRA